MADESKYRPKLNQKRLEWLDRALDESDKLNKRWRHRLTFENLSLAKRYSEAELRLLVWLHSERLAMDYIAIFQDRAGSCVAPNQYKTAPKFCKYPLAVGGHLFSQGHPGKNVTKIEGQSLWNESDGDQEAMLICPAKFIQVPEAINSTFVRFERLDKALSLIPYALYFSPIAGLEFLGAAGNGKIMMPSNLDPLRIEELINEVVESRPQIGNGVANGRAEGERDFLLDSNSVVPSVTLLLGPNFISTSTKGDPFGLEVTDVFFGPFNLDGYANEAVRHEVSSD